MALKKRKSCKLGKVSWVYRENLWPIVASDSGCELRPVHKEENKTTGGCKESISLVEGDVVGASVGSVRSFLRFA